MLNTFPELLTFSFLAPTILRIALGLFLIRSGYVTFTQQKEKYIKALSILKINWGPAGADILGTIRIILGVLLVIGLFTQVCALITIFLLLGSIYVKTQQKSILPDTTCFYSFLVVIAVSLLLTGSGLFAIDIPL